MEHGLEYIAFYVQKYIAHLGPCSDSPMVCDGTIGAPAFVKLAYYQKMIKSNITVPIFRMWSDGISSVAATNHNQYMVNDIAQNIYFLNMKLKKYISCTVKR